MNLFAGLKDILGQINKIDGSIYMQGKNFADVYAKNIALEEEIAIRTKELEQANQTILTLNSVWEMMNSSQPLSSILQEIVNILHKDLNYNYAAVFKLEHKSNGEKFLNVKSSSRSDDVNKLLSYLDDEIEIKEIPYDEHSIIGKTINNKIIYSTPDIKGVVKMFLPALPDEQAIEITKSINSKSCIFVPLHKENENFGFFILTSDRINITDTENNFLILFAKQIELAITVAGLFEEVKKQAVTDPLTGLYNRRYFEENLVKEAERSLRLKQPFSIVALDLDYLKRINDTFGHQYGDVAIKTIANVLRTEARSIDIPARNGGEEFSLMLPGVDSRGASIAAERIRKAIESQQIETIGGVTASIGVATFLEHSDRIDEVIELADQAMYKSKLNGRNQVQIAQTDSEDNWQQLAIDAFIDIISKKRIPIEENISQTIIQKLQGIEVKSANTKDSLCSIVDTISQTYNKRYKTGTTKSKQILAILIAQKLELSKEDIDKLKLAILLYDIGNIMIPEEIFNKKEPLSEKEKEIIKQHPVIAAREILRPISNIQDIIPIIEHHHENWDGKGYPEHKAGIEIPVISQIVLLVDSFYAMTQDRPYRKAYDVEKAIEIIKSEAGKRWNEELIDDFIQVVKDERI